MGGVPRLPPMLIATVDTGTTNTRVRVWRDNVCLVENATSVGVRDTAISGNNAKLKDCVAQLLLDAAGCAGVSLNGVDLILATGMITSNVGLLEIPHVECPAGASELSKAMREVHLPEVAPKPIWFIPGVKNIPPADPSKDFSAIDFMRGEEVEALALIDRLALKGPACLVLPGSHNKFIEIDDQARIRQCVTTLAGELVLAITCHTVLANTLGGALVDQLKPEWLDQGASLAKSQGLTRAAFSVRALGTMAGANQQECANFLLGAILASDLVTLQTMLHSDRLQDAPIIVAGSSPMATAMVLLARQEPEIKNRIQHVTAEKSRNIAGYGAILVAQRRGLIPAVM